MMEPNTEHIDFDPIEPHWEANWRDEGVLENALPWWVWGLWLAFLVWGVVYLVDSASAW